MAASNERIMQDQIEELRKWKSKCIEQKLLDDARADNIDARMLQLADRILKLAEIQKQAADLATQHAQLIANLSKI